MTPTEARLQDLERRVLGRPPEVTDEDRTHPTSGCWFCGLSVAVEADETGRCWFPHAANEPNDTCFGCFLDAHELGFADTEWRTAVEHRDVVVSRLLGRTGWEPGIAERVGWRWSHELDAVEPHPAERFAWVDLDDLRVLADPPEHVCDETCAEHEWLRHLTSHHTTPGVTFGYRTLGGVVAHTDPTFTSGPNTGRPARFDRQRGEWVLAEEPPQP